MPKKITLTLAKRRWLYGVAFAVASLLVALDKLDAAAVPAWLNLAAQILGVTVPVVALAHPTKDGQ